LINEFEQYANGNGAKPLFPDFYTQQRENENMELSNKIEYDAVGQNRDECAENSSERKDRKWHNKNFPRKWFNYFLVISKIHRISVEQFY